MKYDPVIFGTLTIALLCMPLSVWSETPSERQSTPATSTHNIYSVFAPQAHTSNTQLDYKIWDQALSESVIMMGPSLRRFAPQPTGFIGSRIKRGPQSKFRLEGTRVTFSYMSETFKKTLTDYKTDLVSIANTTDIQSLSRDEQLAFWMNLHNVIVIESIANAYPLRQPSKRVINGHRFHEAKLVTIKGVPVSLKNIRQDIVYANWKNPNTIYGFFHGDIGGPGLFSSAFTGENVHDVLKLNAYEYVTSLRGFHEDRDRKRVSKLYQNARPHLFPNWPADLERHLLINANEDVAAEIRKPLPWDFVEYDITIADLWGGDMSTGGGSISSFAPIGKPPILFERAQKIKELKRKGMLGRKSTVIIEDIETDSGG